MKFTWKGKWRNGEIIIEAETFQELDTALRVLTSQGDILEFSTRNNEGAPLMPSVKGCSDAIKILMGTDWGRHPRSMNEIKKALEANALYFSKGSLSGTLTVMTKKGELQRVKENGRWRYLSKKKGA